MKEGLRKRLAESLEAASQLAEGLVEVEILDGDAGDAKAAEGPGAEVLSGPSAGKRGEVLVFSEKFACLNCGTSMPELEPRIFSFNSPHGCCPRCHGLGFQRVIDPELIVPDPTLSISEGALEPWTKAASIYHRRLLEAVAEANGIDIDVALARPARGATASCCSRAPATSATRSPTATASAASARYTVRFDGMLHSLQRRYENTDSENTRERVEALMALQPCPACDGARLRPESLAVTVGGLNIYEYTQLSARRGARVDRGARADRDRARDRAPGRARDRRAAALPRLGRDRLPLARAHGDHALGRRGAADPARDPDRLEPGRRPLHPRRALDRPAPARQREADRDARAPARPRQHRDRGRARRGHDPRRRPRRRPRSRRRRARGRGGRRGHAEGDRGASPARSPASSSPASAQIPVPEERREPRGELVVRGARQHNLKGVDVELPARRLHRGHRRLGLGQVDARQRDPLPRGRQPPAPGADAPGRPRPDRRDRAGRQDHQHRPVADRAHAALQPGHLHRPLRPHPQALRAAPARRGRAATSRGASRFNVKGGRCEVCRGDGQIKIEMHFLPDVYVPCEQCHGRRYNRETLEIRYKGKSIADVLEMSVGEAVEFFDAGPEDRPPAAHPARRRPRLHPARPAGDPALRRRGAAGEARDRALEGRHRRHPLHPRRADHRPALRRRRAPARGARPAGRAGQHGGRDRAQPRRDQVGRPPDRPRPRGRRGRRRDHRHRHPGAGRRRRRPPTPGRFLRELVEAEEPAPKPRRTKRKREPVAA